MFPFFVFPDEVWRVLEQTKFLKTYTDRLYLTVDDAIHAINIKTQIKQAADLKVNYSEVPIIRPPIVLMYL